jgi:hypothetical protein
MKSYMARAQPSDTVPQQIGASIIILQLTYLESTVPTKFPRNFVFLGHLSVSKGALTGYAAGALTPRCLSPQLRDHAFVKDNDCLVHHTAQLLVVRTLILINGGLLNRDNILKIVIVCSASAEWNSLSRQLPPDPQPYVSHIPSGLDTAQCSQNICLVTISILKDKKFGIEPIY